MSAHLSRPRLLQRHLRSLGWVWVWVWGWVHTLLTRSSPSRHPPFTQYPSPSRSLVRDGQTSPHKPRLVVPHSTCPSLSPSPRTQLYNGSCSNKLTHRSASPRSVLVARLLLSRRRCRLGGKAQGGGNDGGGGGGASRPAGKAARAARERSAGAGGQGGDRVGVGGEGKRAAGVNVKPDHALLSAPFCSSSSSSSPSRGRHPHVRRLSTPISLK